MMLKTISLVCGIQTSLMLFLTPTSRSDKVYIKKPYILFMIRPRFLAFTKISWVYHQSLSDSGCIVYKFKPVTGALKQTKSGIMLVTGSDYFSRGVHEPELGTGNGFRETLKST